MAGDLERMDSYPNSRDRRVREGGRSLSLSAYDSITSLAPAIGSSFAGVGSNDGSFALLNEVEANSLHTSWSNSTGEDFLGLSTLVIPNHSAHLVVERPDTMPSRGSVIASRSLSVGECNGISSMIHDAARITNWRTVKALCESNPEAAKYAGRDGWTALHHACNRRCPHADVVEALIRAYPDALLDEEEKGWTPLHYACRFKATKDVVRLLVQLFPDKGRVAVSRKDRQGRTPLYYAVRYDAPQGVVSTLLEVDASAVLAEDQNADSPLALVWDAWAEKLEGKRSLQRLYIPESEAASMTPEERASRMYKRLEGQSRLLERWKKVNTFLKAAFGFSVEDSNGAENEKEEKKASPGSPARFVGRKWRILHATASIKCHPSLFLLACALHPEQAFETDENDLKGPIHVSGGFGSAFQLTALHLAASSRANGEAGRVVISELLKLNPDAASAAASDGSLPLHRMAQNTYRSDWNQDGAKILYLANSGAVRTPDANGKLPLHRAAAAIVHREAVSSEDVALRSVIVNLLLGYANGASHADNTGCLPFHYIAQHAEIWDLEVQSLYEAYPAAVRARAGVVHGNRLPIHMAAANRKAQTVLIQKLMELNPRAASQYDRYGKLPLHLACETGLAWDAVRFIQDAFPEAITHSEQNERGWNSLQMAAACSKSDADLLANLVQLHSASASMADSSGRFALHLACLAGKSWEGGLMTLFEANPDAMRSADRSGLLPFHIACFRYCIVEKKTKCPKMFDITIRRLSHSTSLDGGDRRSEADIQDAHEIEILYHLLKADPTVL